MLKTAPENRSGFCCFYGSIQKPIGPIPAEYILQRQREGIAIAKKQGKYTGRKPRPLPDNFERVVARWRTGEITAAEAMRQTGLKPNTFYRRCAANKPLALK